jgi:threonyl-tRNA synthetase
MACFVLSGRISSTEPPAAGPEDTAMSAIRVSWDGGEAHVDAGPNDTVGQVLARAKAPDTLIGAKVDGTLRGVMDPVGAAAELAGVAPESPDGLFLLRHSSAHVMATAIQELYPGTRFAIGPPIADGFYYDMESPRAFTPEDLEAIEKKMRGIIAQKMPFQRIEANRLEAIARFKASGDPYKVEILEGLPDDGVTYYVNGPFTDLCRGPHAPSTGSLNPKAFRLLQVAGAYWRGDEKRPMLQRIYGTTWATPEDLAKYLDKLEQAKLRDHRKLGKELDLFSVHEDGGAGLIFWHPKGGRIRRAVEDYWRDAHLNGGYEIVYTPHVGKSTLWETSGHLGFYRENMYAPLDVDGQEYFLKPMNCPFHILIYQTAMRSYRDLPFRWAELGTVYRYERSGVLHGLLRVRGFTQDDAHLFCRPDQMPAEIDRVIGFCLDMLKAFGFENFEIFLSTRPEKSVGDPEQWASAEVALRAALEGRGLAFQVDEGGGAFYGPKIDIKIKDALDREWQCSTIQFDFNLPERFNLTYIGEDGKEHRPYMIHRALLGSLERFFGVLIEHYAGAFPAWLAPVQVSVIPVSEQNMEYAQAVRDELAAAGVRADILAKNEKIGAKIRDAEKSKVPYMLVVGARDAEAGTVSVRAHGGRDLGALPRGEFVKKVVAEIESHQ